MKLISSVALAALFLLVAGSVTTESMTCTSYTSNGLDCTECCGDVSSDVCVTFCSNPKPEPEPEPEPPE